MRVAYVGQKPSKHDNIAGTGLSWAPGEAHTVSDAVGQMLCKFPTIWCDVTPPAVPAMPVTAPVTIKPPPPVLAALVTSKHTVKQVHKHG